MQTTKPTMLLYNIKGTPQEKTLTLICLKHKIRARAVEPSKYNHPLHTLFQTSNQSSNEQPNSTETAQLLSEPMLVFHGFSNNQFNQVLRDLKNNNIRIPLKAVATPHNLSWTSIHLYQELQEEHQKFQSLES